MAWTPSKAVSIEPEKGPLRLDHLSFDDYPSISGRSNEPLQIAWVGNSWQVRNASRTHGLWVRMPAPASNVEPYDQWPLIEPATDLWPAARGQASEFALTACVEPAPAGLGDPRGRAARSIGLVLTQPPVDPFTGTDPARLVDELDPYHAHELRLGAARGSTQRPSSVLEGCSAEK